MQAHVARGFYSRKSYLARQAARTLLHRRDIARLNLGNLGGILRDLSAGLKLTA